MKINNFFPAAILAFSVLGLFSLLAFLSPEPISPVANWCTTVCTPGESGDRNEISTDCANCWMENFASNGYQFNEVPGDDGELEHVRGVEIPLEDLQEVLNRVNNLTNSGYIVETYGMFGLEVPTEESTPEPKLIFQVQGLTKEGATANASVNYFYDFTNPCPSLCPEGDGNTMR